MARQRTLTDPYGRFRRTFLSAAGVAAPLFVAAGAETESTSTSFGPVALPAGVAENDILLCVLLSSDTLSLAGWSIAKEYGSVKVYWKRAGASETNPTFTKSGSSVASARITAWRNLKRTGTPFLDAKITTGTGIGSTQWHSPALTTIPNTLLVAVGGRQSTTSTSGFSLIINGGVDATNGNPVSNGTHYTDTTSTGGVFVASMLKVLAGNPGTTGFGNGMGNSSGLDQIMIPFIPLLSDRAPVNVDVPVITMGLTTMSTHSASTGNWYAEPGGTSDITYTYQWKKSSDNTNLPGTSNTSTYTPIDNSLANTAIYVTVTATNSLGSVSANSASTTVPNVVGYVGVGAETESSSTSFAVARPAGIQTDDILLCALQSSGSETLSLAGWTLVDQVGTLAVYWHRVAGGDTDPTFTKSGSSAASARITAYRGAATAGTPIDAVTKTAGAISGIASYPSVTTTVPNDMIVLVIGGVSTNDTLQFGTLNNGTLASKTNRYVDTYTTGRVALGTAVMASAGATGSTTTNSLGNSNAVNTMTIALAPAGGRLVGVGATHAVTGGTDFTPGLPAGVQEGDLLLVPFMTNSAVIPTSSGWTRMTSIDESTVKCWYKWAGASETAPTFTTTGSGQGGGAIVAIRGLTGSGNPFDATATVEGETTTPWTWTGLTTVAGKTAVIFTNSQFNTNSVTGYSGTPTNTALRGLQFLFSVQPSGSSSFGVWIGFKDTAGSVGTTTLSGVAALQHWLSSFSVK